VDSIRSVRPAGEYMLGQRRSILWHAPPLCRDCRRGAEASLQK
jgi:hypothetical protein